jgi:protein-L-isoaspartate(D-aspartate) O-methyltransferase
MTDVAEDLTPHAARQHLVERLTVKGVITRPEVAAAFRTVPRHVFAPAGTDLQTSYADDVMITKKGADGRATSSVSAPWLSLSTPAVLRSGRHRLDTSLTCSL